MGCFVPLTQLEVSEINLELQPHHIIALLADKGQIERALAEVPCRKRPQVRTDHRAEPAPEECEDAEEDRVAIVEELVLSGMRIRNTFLEYPDVKDVSETSAMCQSAPCGHCEAAQPPNPRRWSP